MSSELEELSMNEPDYTDIINDMIKEAGGLRASTAIFKSHLQAQFIKEADEGSSSHNRGMLYAQCGTNCQAMSHLLNAIVSDLELLEDLPLNPKRRLNKNGEYEEGELVGVIEEIQIF